MSVHEITPLPPGCPWADWARPNVKWCEENLCGYITAPANTWTNLSYMIFGLWMMRDGSKKKSNTLYFVGVASILVGVTSFVYHASYTAQGQFLDFVGMYMFSVIPVVLNGRRLQVLKKKHELVVGVGAVILLSVFTALVQLEIVMNPKKFPIQLLVAFLVAITLVQEVILYRRKVEARRANFYLSVFFIAAAFSCSIMDATNVWCDPHDHVIQGHGMWHILSSISLQFIYMFYSQFDLNKDPLLPLEKSRK